MIDIHCHILPGVDDGAENMAEARMMAAIAADDGIREIIVTPHVTLGDSDMMHQLQHIKEVLSTFQAELDKVGIPVLCHCGAEVLCRGKLTEEILRNIPCIEGTSCVLTEFFFNASAEDIEKYIYVLLKAGYTPVIAHPERYGAVKRDRGLLEKWKKAGCLLQLNKGSLMGDFGWSVKRTACYMMRHRLADFLATDAHDTRGRSPRMLEVCEKFSKRFGEEYLYQLTEENPRKLLNNEFDR